jgi:hypothetical protein
MPSLLTMEYFMRRPLKRCMLMGEEAKKRKEEEEEEEEKYLVV